MKGYAILTGLFIILVTGCQSPSFVPAAGYTERYTASSPDLENETGSPLPSMDERDLPELTAHASLQDYVTYAAINNAGLEAAFNRWKAAVEAVPQVTALPDPRFTYRYYIEQVETRVGAQRQSFGISQMFPWFGKLDLQGDAASEAAKAARQRFEAEKLGLYFQVKDAWYEYYYLLQAIDSVDENITLLQNFENVVRVRYQAATARHPDLIRAQVELGKLEDQLRSLRELQEPIAARLNAALNRPPAAPLAEPNHVSAESIAASDQEVLAMMDQQNPELAALRHEIARTRSNVALAQKQYYPDVTLGVDFIDTADAIGPMAPSDSGQDPIVAMVSLNLPIWRGKLDAGVRQARYQYRAAVNDRTQKLNSLNARLKRVLYEYRDAERKIDLYGNTLLPKAIESVKANEASFRSGESTFLEVIDAQRVLLDFELAYERALASKAQRLAEMEMLVGTELPRQGN